MSDESTYAAMRAYIDVRIELMVEKRTQPLNEEIRSLRAQLETRGAAQSVAGPPGKDGVAGKDGRDGKDGVPGAPGTPGALGERGADGLAGTNGKDGRDGVDGRAGAPGEKGERGADGVATRGEIEAIVEERAASISVRTFADIYKGVFKPGDLYTRGALSTWGGSLWLSLVDTRAKPGESPDWKLVVKK